VTREPDAARRRSLLPAVAPLVVALGDLALVHGGFLAAFLVRFDGVFPRSNFQAYIRAAPGLTVVALVLFLSYGLYDVRPQSWRTASSGVTAAVTLLQFFGAGLSFVVRAFAFPRSVFLIAWVLQMLLLLLWRYAVWRLLAGLLGPGKALVVGPDGEAQEFARRIGAGRFSEYRVAAVVVSGGAGGLPEPLEEGRWEQGGGGGGGEGGGGGGQEVAATGDAGIPAGSRAGESARAVPEIPLAALPAYARRAGVGRADLLVLTPSASADDKARVAAFAAGAGLRVAVIPGYRDLLVLDSRMTQIDSTLAFEVGTTGIPPQLAWAKRLMDICLSLTGLLLALPFLPFIALAVKASSPGPVFYGQKRVGLGGRVYTLWKFRTMRRDAEAGTGPVLSRAGDPRVTGVGRFLRHYRLDEIPQLWNVLTGSMSLVGPRPERLEFVREHARSIPYYEQRHLIRPGLTGLAQLSARYDTPVEEKLRYDLLYAKRYSLLLDLRILLLTAQTVLKGEEAHFEEERES